MYSQSRHAPYASQRSDKSARIIVAAARTGKRRDFEEWLRDVGFVEDDGKTEHEGEMSRKASESLNPNVAVRGEREGRTCPSEKRSRNSVAVVARR